MDAPWPYVATADGQSRLWLRSAGIRIVSRSRRNRRCELALLVAGQPVRGFFCRGQAQTPGRRQRIGANAGDRVGRSRRHMEPRECDPVRNAGESDQPHSGRGRRPCSSVRTGATGQRFPAIVLPRWSPVSLLRARNPELRGVYVGDLDGRLTPRRLFDSDTGAVYAPSGHVLFALQGTLFAHAFDPVQLELTGKPFPIAEHVASEELGTEHLGVADRLDRVSGELEDP